MRMNELYGAVKQVWKPADNAGAARPLAFPPTYGRSLLHF